MSTKETSTDRDNKVNMWATASFVLVIIVLGIPLWWKTTDVYRVALPYSEIAAFVPSSHFVTTELTVLANDAPTADEIAGIIEQTFDNSDIIKLKINKAVLPDEVHHTLESSADDQDAVDEISHLLNLDRHNHLYVVQRRPIYHDVWAANERVLFFRDAKASNTLVSVLSKWFYQFEVLTFARSERSADAARRVRFPPNAGYHIMLSVVNPDPEALHVDFDAAGFMEDYIGTFTDELSSVYNITLKSQWLNLLKFDLQTQEIKDTSEWGRHLAISRDRLDTMLTRLEERAATHVSPLPTVNLALVTFSCKLPPLYIYDEHDQRIQTPVQAFMSPKWGGVYIGHPSYEECRDQIEGSDSPAIWRVNERVVAGTMIAQLRPLLGIPDVKGIENAFLVPLRSVKPRKWEIDNLLRLRAIEQITSAELTLQSLAKLLGQISNIVINDQVGDQIKSAVKDINEANVLLRDGKLDAAYNKSQAAFLAAEAAFVDPSLLELLYFPEDQKYAVYVPLYLPIIVPVLLTLRRLYRMARGLPVHKVDDKEKTE